jgi:hypothetical protein
MKKITITTEAHSMIRACAGSDVASPAQPRPDGLVDVPIRTKTYEQFMKFKFPGESDSDRVIRLMALFRSSGRMN